MTTLRLILALMRTYRYAIAAVVVLSVVTAVYLHIRNDGIRDTELTIMQRDIASSQSNVAQLKKQIVRMNEDKLAAAVAAAERVRVARVAAEEVRAENDRIATENAALRYEILEGMQNDEDYADWAYGSVDPNAWRLLQQAASTGAGRVRTGDNN